MSVGMAVVSRGEATSGGFRLRGSPTSTPFLIAAHQDSLCQFLRLKISEVDISIGLRLQANFGCFSECLILCFEILLAAQGTHNGIPFGLNASVWASLATPSERVRSPVVKSQSETRCPRPATVAYLRASGEKAGGLIHGDLEDSAAVSGLTSFVFQFS